MQISALLSIPFGPSAHAAHAASDTVQQVGKAPEHIAASKAQTEQFLSEVTSTGASSAVDILA